VDSDGDSTTLKDGCIISLDRRPKTLRIGPKQHFAIIIGNYLWTVRDKVIEIVCPFEDAVFLKTRIDIPSTVGAVTSIVGQSSQMTPIDSLQPISDVLRRRAFTGHVDGKILEWDADLHTRRRVIDMGSYRISGLVAPSDRMLWVAFGTGKISALDVSYSDGDSILPFDVTVVKEWQAETSDPMVDMVLDPDSMIHCGELHVATISKNGSLQLWDALIPTDFSGAL
jgi:hypothetical protein